MTEQTAPIPHIHNTRMITDAKTAKSVKSILDMRGMTQLRSVYKLAGGKFRLSVFGDAQQVRQLIFAYAPELTIVTRGGHMIADGPNSRIVDVATPNEATLTAAEEMSREEVEVVESYIRRTFTGAAFIPALDRFYSLLYGKKDNGSHRFLACYDFIQRESKTDLGTLIEEYRNTFKPGPFTTPAERAELAGKVENAEAAQAAEPGINYPAWVEKLIRQNNVQRIETVEDRRVAYALIDARLADMQSDPKDPTINYFVARPDSWLYSQIYTRLYRAEYYRGGADFEFITPPTFDTNAAAYITAHDYLRYHMLIGYHNTLYVRLHRGQHAHKVIGTFDAGPAVVGLLLTDGDGMPCEAVIVSRDTKLSIAVSSTGPVWRYPFTWSGDLIGERGWISYAARVYVPGADMFNGAHKITADYPLQPKTERPQVVVSVGWNGTNQCNIEDARTFIGSLDIAAGTAERLEYLLENNTLGLL